MKNIELLSPYRMGAIDLKNRIVMAPMTRSRAIGNIPNDLFMAGRSQRNSIWRRFTLRVIRGIQTIPCARRSR